MALQHRLRRDLTNLLLSTPSYLNRLQVQQQQQQQRSQLHTSGVSQRFSSLLLRVSRDTTDDISLDSDEKKRRRDDDCCPSTKPTSIKQDVGSPARAVVSLIRGDKPSGELLSARACRLPDKLIRDEVPQGPWSRQRAPDFPPKCSPCAVVEKPDCDEPCPPVTDCVVREPCPTLDDPCGESRDCCSFRPYAGKSYFSTGLLSRSWSHLQTRGLHVSGLKSGVGRGHSSGKSNNRNKSKKAAKKPNTSNKLREGKEICTKGPREKCYGRVKKASSKKFTSCEPDDSWKKQHCLGDSRGSDTCSINKPQCTETVGPTYRELEKSHEDKRMKAWKQSKIVADKCQPDDSWKESKTCTKNSDSCSAGKPQCGGAKRSYSTLSRILLNFQESTVQPSRSLMSGGGGLSRECNSGDAGRNEKDKSGSDVFKKEMQEIEECITAAKCKVPLPKSDKANGDGKSPKKGKK